MTQQVALLSNVNMNFVIRLLKRQVDIYETEGYGNELGTLMNPESSYHAFAPDYTFLVMDLMELLEHELEETSARERINSWFEMLEGTLQPAVIYYISDAYLWGPELDVITDVSHKQVLEQMWLSALKMFCEKYNNVRIFPYRHLVERLGELQFFSPKMWYMGKILMTNDAQKALAEEILLRMQWEQRFPKKVLLLDLDNTLWGGLAGEADRTPIVLSEDHEGLAYKNLQRVLLRMAEQGVLLGIVSKNNEEDAMEIIRKHPHMILREEAFVIKRINWQPKHENIMEIAKELNLGVDSFVFWDDNPTERELIKSTLPQVEVPDFPERPEELAPEMVKIYRQYFAKASLTGEDLVKTKQYAANVKRDELQAAAVSFEDYLKQLQIVIRRVDPARHLERITQLANKTNQFNLTTRRYTLQEMQEVVGDVGHRVFAYQVEDRFGDNGLVAIVIVRLPGVCGENKTAEKLSQACEEPCPVVEEFVMSCRVMGKQIENAVLEDVERSLEEEGYTCLEGIYLPTAKNKPVEELYSQLGYEKLRTCGECGTCYRVVLDQRPKRKYRIKALLRRNEE